MVLLEKGVKSCGKRPTHCLGVECLLVTWPKRYGADEGAGWPSRVVAKLCQKLSDRKFLGAWLIAMKLDPALKTGATTSGMGWSGIYKRSKKILDWTQINHSSPVLKVAAVGSGQMSTLDKTTNFVNTIGPFQGWISARHRSSFFGSCRGYKATQHSLAHQGLPFIPDP